MHVDDHFATQFGLVTRKQAREAGLSERQIDRRLARGRWIRVHRGVYRLAAVPSTWRARALAPAIATNGVVSFRAAARLHRLDGVARRPTPEITLPHRNRATGLDGVIVHRTTQWTTSDHRTIDGIPVTGVERTLMDCASVVSLDHLERMAESAIRRGMSSWAAIESQLLAEARRGRNGSAGFRKLCVIRSPVGDMTLSDFGLLVAQHLERAGVPKPRREFRIHTDDGRFVMQADLAWPDRKKAWELDGLAWHFGRVQTERDRRKRNHAKSHGWAIQEILWSMWEHERESLVPMAIAFLSS